MQQKVQQNFRQTVQRNISPKIPTNVACSRHFRRQQRRRHLPGAASTHASAARSKSVIVAHNQLRLDLLHRVHGHAHYDQQGRTTKVKVHSQTIQHPVRQRFEYSSERAIKMVKVNASNQPLWDK